MWQVGRGLVALDEDGQQRWTHPLMDEAYWGLTIQHDGRVVLGAPDAPRIVLDARTGGRLFACEGPCALLDYDEGGFLSAPLGQDDHEITLVGLDGAVQWRRALEPEDAFAHGSFTHGSMVLTDRYVAVCRASGPVRFFAREDGRPLSTHAMPRAPEGRRSGSERCELEAVGDLVLAYTEHGAALFGPASDVDVPAPEAEVVTTPIPTGDRAPNAPRVFYELASVSPPPEGYPSGYAEGRAAYLEARDAFHAGRFDEAARGFLQVYRHYSSTDNPEIQQVGFDACFDIRLAVDQVGEAAALEAVLVDLDDEADAVCERIVRQGTPPD